MKAKRIVLLLFIALFFNSCGAYYESGYGGRVRVRPVYHPVVYRPYYVPMHMGWGHGGFHGGYHNGGFRGGRR